MFNSTNKTSRIIWIILIIFVVMSAVAGLKLFTENLPKKNNASQEAALQKDTHFGLDKIGNLSQSGQTLKKFGITWTYKDINPNMPSKEIDDFIKKAEDLEIVPVLNLSTADRKYPSDEIAWKNFIQKTVDRYDGDGKNDLPKLKTPIKYWHVIQEWKVHWKGTAEEYVAFLNMTGDTIKKEDPDAKIVLVGIAGRAMEALVYKYNLVKTPAPLEIQGITGNQDYENEMKYIFENGKYDIVDFHSYEKNYFIEAKVKLLRDVYKIKKPIWVMEAGGPFLKKSEGYTNEISAQFLVKQHVQAFANGIERYIWALGTAKSGGVWDSEPWINMPLLDTKQKPKQSFYTFDVLVDKLKGFTKVENLTIKNDGPESDYVYVFKFIKPDKTVYVLWADAGAKHSIQFSGKSNVLVTDTITAPGQKTPKTKSFSPKNGKVTFDLTANPLFVE
ncbi:MAG: hypothetical protein AAB397_03610 [Patescibacteria group bacterium]